MTWDKAKNLTPEEVASMVHLLLYAAVDGMEGCDLKDFRAEEGKSSHTLRYDGYWHGCVETAARTMAFLFSDTKYTNFDGVGTGDAVDTMLFELERAALYLMDNDGYTCPHCKQTIQGAKQDRLNRAERSVDSAAIKFFDVYAPKDLANEVTEALRTQQRQRERSRRTQMMDEG